MPTVVGRHDDFEVRVLVDQRERLAVALLGHVVAIDRIDQFDRGVLGVLEGLLEGRDPGVLVGRVGRGRKDRELAAVRARE